MNVLSTGLHGGLIIILAIITTLYYNYSKRTRIRLSRVSLSEKLSIATGHKALIGIRPTMEDGHVISLNLQYEGDKADSIGGSPKIPSATGAFESPSVCLFGIFDGHSGTACSNYLSANMHQFIARERNIFYGSSSEEVCEAICRAFLAADASFANALFGSTKRYGDRSAVTAPTPGSTACICVLDKDKLYVANAGDSRAVLGRINSVEFSIFHIDMSKDHKPSRNTEVMRIRSVGGSVQTSHISSNKCLISVGPLRVWPGGLSVSRGIGDFSLKANKELESQGVRGDLVTAYPEIRYKPTNILDQFLVIACDGLYDVLSSEEIVNFVHANRPTIMIEEMRSMIDYKGGDAVSYSHTGEELSDPVQDQYIHGDNGSAVRRPWQVLQMWSRRILRIIHRSFAMTYGKLMSSPLNLSEVSTAIPGDREFTEVLEFNDDMIQQADCKCAQKLADKLTRLAMERDATDNVSVIVVLFRWKGVTPNTIEGWRSYNQILSRHSAREDGDLRPPLPEFSDEDSCIAQNRADDVVLWSSKDDPGYAFLKK